MAAFEPPTPYEGVDLDDPITRGKLSHAASHGDARAKLTLKAWNEKQDNADEEKSGDRRKRLANGRDMYNKRGQKDDHNARLS